MLSARLLLLVIIPVVMIAAGQHVHVISTTDRLDMSSHTCSPSWSLPGARLKDHTLFAYQGYYYIVSIKIDLPIKDDRGEYTFAYARTKDLCTWEDLGIALSFGARGDADEAYIWAPYVFQDGDTFYMFYTGVNHAIAQSIMLATSTNPSDPHSWVKQGVAFRPNHEGMVYGGADVWSDARDPMVIRYDDTYFLYYTGRDVTGGIVGVAMADSLRGPWRDLGAVLRTSATVIPESPFVLAYDGVFYLYYNAAGGDASQPAGAYWQWAPSPFGPWQPPVREPLGWGHDFFSSGSDWMSSFVLGSGESIGFAPVGWTASSFPPRPTLGRQIFLPMVVNTR